MSARGLSGTAVMDEETRRDDPPATMHAGASRCDTLELKSTTAAAAADQADGAIRVLCVDDHEVLVSGIRAQFGIERAIKLVGWLDSAENLLESARTLNPHVVLLDIEMPGPDAFEIADRLHHALPRVAIIILSAHIREAFLAAAFRCGASGYFAKSDHLSEIVQGIRDVACRRNASSVDSDFVLGTKVRERCLLHNSEDAAERSRRAPGSRLPDQTRLSVLSDRELEVLRLIGKGMTRESIADHLCRSVKTIDGHQIRIKTKLGLTTREDLMLLAIREGLAEVT